MKKYFILIIVQFLISNDIETYEISLYKIPMAEVVITYENIILENQKAINLKFETQTNKFASKIFKVNNTYETIIESNNFNILSFNKTTYQPGLINQIKTTNKNNNVLYQDTDTIIPKNYFNIFSLLYYLTITPDRSLNDM